MKNTIALLLVFASLFLTGCHSNKLVQIDQSSDCLTSIEGNYFAPQIYKHYAPSVLFPPSHKLRYQGGDVLQYDSTGVLFLKKKDGLLSSRDTVFYRYDEITAIVDSQKYLVWGKLADRDRKKCKVVFSLTNLSDSTYKPLEITLISDEHFAYCAKPGWYTISSVQVSFPDELSGIILCSTVAPIVKFEVKENMANYIGDIQFLGADTKKTANLFIPYRKVSSNYIPVPTAPLGAGGVLAATLLVVLAVDYLSSSSQNTETPYLGFHIEHNPQFTPFVKGKLENTLFLDPNKK